MIVKSLEVDQVVSEKEYNKRLKNLKMELK